MKKGKLIKEGKNWKIASPDFKQPMSIAGDFGFTDDMANQEIEFDNSGGPIALIKFEGKSYSKKQNNADYQNNRGPRNQNHRNTQREQAPPGNERQRDEIKYSHAPYNFVPINEIVVDSQLEAEDIFFDWYNSEYLTGKITLEIESLSPIFIRGNKSLGSNTFGIESDFFKGKDYCIPGSSLRGLLRTMTEIVSYSKMGSINKATKSKKFHYRAFADRSLDLRNAYSSKMIGREGNPTSYFPKVHAGVIQKNGKDYIIYKGEHYRVEEDLAYENGIIDAKMSLNRGNRFVQNQNYNTRFRQIYFKAEEQRVHQHSQPLKYAKVTDIRNEYIESFSQGYLVCSGWMIGNRNSPRGKHMHWVVGNINYNNEIKILEEVIVNYTNDINRNGMNIIRELQNPQNTEVPCFFITDNQNTVLSFGHTGMFRLAYDKTLIDFFPDGHRNIDDIDFTETIFGKADVVPSRVFVEDAYLEDTGFIDQIKIPAIMGSPKPTTFQHYLKQNIADIYPVYNNRGLSGFNGLNDYNSDTLIRGNKLYWHQNEVNYPEEIEIKTSTFQRFLQQNNLSNVFSEFRFEGNRTSFKLATLTRDQFNAVVKFNLSHKEAQHTAIRPVLKNAKFYGTIRFENLTKVELGALLFILNLPDEMCLKIGMGKGLGLGSIRIKPVKALLSNRSERYSSLISEWGELDEKKSLLQANEIDTFINNFEQYVLNAIGSSSKSLWDEDRLIELKTMLNIKNKPEGEKIKYMQIVKEYVDENNSPKKENEYKDRPILQSPSDYIKKP